MRSLAWEQGQAFWIDWVVKGDSLHGVVQRRALAGRQGEGIMQGMGSREKRVCAHEWNGFYGWKGG